MGKPRPKPDDEAAFHAWLNERFPALTPRQRHELDEAFWALTPEQQAAVERFERHWDAQADAAAAYHAEQAAGATPPAPSHTRLVPSRPITDADKARARAALRKLGVRV